MHSLSVVIFVFYVAQDGSCMFHAIRRALDYPKDYTSTHLRKQLIAFISDHADYYMNHQPF